MSHPYRTLVFDCINTVLLPNPERLPRLMVDGKEVTSTAPLLMEHVAAHLPGLPAEDVHHAMRRAWRWAEEQRGPELREVPATLRFRRLLDELELDHVGEALAGELLAAHMAAVTGCYDLPPAHREVLAELKDRFSLALFSNFDHRPSLMAKLVAEDIADWFDPLIISDGLGYRKPGAAAFSLALELLREAPERVLMVGDSLEDDVAGCHGAGIDIAWINPRGAPVPESAPPRYVLASLTGLPKLLGF
ncbi:MAG: HAD family hydrolase [bacterium]